MHVLFFIITSLFFSAALLSIPQKSKVDISNKTGSAIVVNSTTTIPPRTKAQLITKLTNLKSSSLPTKNNANPWFNAIVLKKIDQINSLVESGFIPDERTILFAMDNNLPTRLIIKLTQKAGYNLSHVFPNGISLAKYAFQRMPTEIDSIIYLIENGGSFSNENMQCGIMTHAPSDEDILALLQAFLKNNYSIDFILKTDWFRYFARDEVLDLLFRFGLNPNATIEIGNSSRPTSLLCYFIRQNRVASVEKLIAHGADINQMSFDPNDYSDKKITPLRLALNVRKQYGSYNSCENDKIIELLVAHGAVLNDQELKEL